MNARHGRNSIASGDGVWERVHGGIIDGERMHPASLINWSIGPW
jgi:hypothetical protein